MKTTIRCTLCALALAAPAWILSRAADADPSPTTGHVLVLENERTLEGDIERQGSQYRVRRIVGETWVPGEEVLRLCANWQEAYEYLRGRANLRDPDERLRLARWCHLHGLRDQALAEVSAAVALQPGNLECQRLQRSLERSATVAASGPTARPREEAESVPPLPPVDLTTESMTMFAMRVQPILMNTCASCHMSNKGGAFKLTRAIDNGLVSRRATQQNLAAVLAQVNLEHWQSSPLLIKAVSVHGETGQPPLKGKQAPTYKKLEEWVQMAVANNPQLTERSPGFASAGESRTTAEPVARKVEVTPMDQAAVRPVTPAKAPPGPANEIPASMPAKSLEPVDAFDPVIFNRQMHPEK